MVKNILLIGVAALIGYTLYRKGVSQYYKAQGWDWKLIRFDILKLTLSQLRAYVAIELKNTSDLSATVEQVKFDVFSNEVFIGQVSRPEPYTINANSAKQFDFVADINLRYTRNLFPTLLKALADKDLPLMFSGSFVVRQGVAKVKVPFEYNTTLKELYS